MVWVRVGVVRANEEGPRGWRTEVNAIFLRLQANRNTNCAWGRPPIWERGVELGGRVLYPVKLLHIKYNLFAGTEMLSLSAYEPIAIHILLQGTVPQFGRKVRVSGRMWYHMKANHNGHTLFLKPIHYRASLRSKTSCKCWGWGRRPPNLGEGVGLEGGVPRVDTGS